MGYAPGSTKLVKASMYALTIAYLMRPNWFYAPTYSPLLNIVGTFLFSLFSFLRVHKKHKNANKRLDIFKHIFNFFSLICVFLLLLGWVFMLLMLLVLLVLMVRAKSFCKKGFKTALITSFTLLLSCVV